jgi:hypothetical protein
METDPEAGLEVARSEHGAAHNAEPTNPTVAIVFLGSLNLRLKRA